MTRRLLAVAGAVALLATALPASAAPLTTTAGHLQGRQLLAYLRAVQHRPTLSREHGGPQAVRPSAATPAVLSYTGPTLVYTQASTTSPAVIIVERDLLTGHVQVLLPAAGNPCADEAKLSPDSSRVVYLDFGPACASGGQVRVLELATGVVTVLATAATDEIVDLPNWSPDSSTVLFSKAGVDDLGNVAPTFLYTAPATGGAVTKLGGASAIDAYDGVYSPDGTKIVYVSLNGNFSLDVMQSDGVTYIKQLSHTELSPVPLAPAWSPDASQVSFTYLQHAYDTPNGELDLTGVGTVDYADTARSLDGAGGNSSTAGFATTWSADGTELFYDGQVVNTTTGVPITNGSLYAYDLGLRTTVLVRDATHAYGSPSFSGPSPSTGTASTFTPVTPTRVLPKTVLGPGGEVDVRVSGGTSPVPAGATAVTLNLTGVTPTAGTYLQIYPRPATGHAFPLVSNVNLAPGQIAAVGVQVSVAPDGYVRVRNNAGSTGVVVDVSGYFTAGTGASAYTPIPAARALDTTIGAGGSADVVVTGLGPANPGFTPVAAVVNLTAAGPSRGTYLSAYPTPASVAPPPLVSTLNLPAHAIRANLATVPIGVGGKITVYNAFGTVRAVVDVVGYYGTGGTGGLSYFALQPTRVLDTRNATGTVHGLTTPVGPRTGIGTPTFEVFLRGSTNTPTAMITVPTTAKALVFNLTAVQPTASTFLTVYPEFKIRPDTSNLNVPAHAVVPNLVIVGLDSSGVLVVDSLNGQTPIVIDLAGYYDS